jgi:Leucine-rich repeat (LRR) protein
MKYIKYYKENIEYLDEDIWEYEESDFYQWLINKYPDKSKWDQIKLIDCSNQELIDLDGIEELKNLEKLYCGYNNLTDLKGIENSTKLKFLYCRNNNLTSLKGIENLTNLRNLICNNNNLTSLEEIENLTKLVNLYCYSNNFSDEYKDYLKNYFIKKSIFFHKM